MQTSMLQRILLFSGILLLSSLLNLSGQVVINEYSCSNINTIADDYGSYEDWIELHNPTGAAINISGYFLSDNPANPTKWQIPAGTSIPANGFTLFFASGRNVANGLSFHTNFKLTQTNFESIILADVGGAIVDQIATNPARANHSRGRIPNGSANWGIFSTPTPGTSNGTGYTSYTTTPSMNVAAGVYASAVTVSLSSPDAGVTIRYTTDGSEPTTGSTAYSTPLNVSTSTVVKARAFPSSASILAGFTETNSYLIGISHTLPVVSLSSDQYTNLFNSGTPEITSSIEYFNTSGTLQFESFGDVNGHGNDSWAYPQKGVDFVVRDQLGYDSQIDYQVFPTKPRAQFQRLILKAAASDNYPFTFGSGGGCYLRDAYIQSLAQTAHMNVDLRTNDHCALYINGQYWGLYEIREKVNDPDYTDYYWNQKEEDLDMLSYWGGLNIRYGSDTDWNDLYSYMMSTDLSQAANYNTVSSRLDVASVIDYIILNSWAVNSDWINWNTMWWRGRGTPNVKWKYALWDMDNTFDLGQNYSGWPTTDFTADPCALDQTFENAGPDEGHLDIFNRLMANADFKQRYVNRYAEMISTYLNCDFALAHFDSIVAHITPEMPNQVARWGGTMAGWQANLTYMRSQITNRCQYIANQGIINCYEVTGPYDLAFNVEPANSGTIRFNELTVPTYPWSGTYFGGVEGDIEATPATNYEFWYWEIFHSNLTSDSTQSLNSFLIEASDSIVAHFRIVETNPITYIIEPAGSGTVSINGITPASFPFTTIYNVGMPVSLSATPNPNYEFVWYEAIHHSFNPDSATIDASFVTDTSDTIIVHFQPLQTWTLTVLVDPPGAGKVNIDGNWLSTYPQTFTYFPGAVVSSDVIAFDDYLFSHWTLEQTALVNDSNNTINGCVIDTNDTLTAHFNLREIIPQTMYVPNSFTPNNDGLNDFFQCFHTETVGKGNVVIFNRWGEEVYRSGMLDFKWDGKYLNSDLPEDVYFYVLNYYLKADYFETAQGKIVLYR